MKETRRLVPRLRFWDIRGECGKSQKRRRGTRIPTSENCNIASLTLGFFLGFFFTGLFFSATSKGYKPNGTGIGQRLLESYGLEDKPGKTGVKFSENWQLLPKMKTGLGAKVK